MGEIQIKIIKAPFNKQQQHDILAVWKQQVDYHSELDGNYYVSFGDLEKEWQHFSDLEQEGIVWALIEQDDEHNDRIMGILIAEIGTEDYTDTKIKKFIEIHEFVIAKRLRGRGFGQKMIKVLQDHFKSTGLPLKLLCNIHNKRTMEFYEKLGFRTVNCVMFQGID